MKANFTNGKWAPASLSAVLFLWSALAHATVVELDFNSLPSAQGWYSL